ncbi:MAG: xanthine dehydrogenase family protein molybdopterin-binding subunit [Nitrososphaerota archaeon]|jgi:CO/xanthine dehydrogenase Mo-binding subunit|nr:xanthine dehydrogenase family protein molybdopterin-binding subunit [Nitrososphaerota archaeon]MDG6903882.1 xanthine dehydrogenase family protein molybdopterin-binding subunit [Nitrososphaerota archaeon]MDG6912476.1 xanthine dehydrogenase family protein molybdopterin-binding subunit [Nitrososphaerota archaeon]MDG6919206.1 xanthine dehydrogenase family protein molybdopterin-binding subunit [Nitrososphaerota archaeon]MDG6920611.1 xanthine dehydrogenase family protein molybdopterin-binding subu
MSSSSSSQSSGENNLSTNAKFALVGNPAVTRRDLYAKITGQRKYTQDIVPSDIGASSMWYAGFLVAPHPHAIVTSIDTSEAQNAGYVTLVESDLPVGSLFSGGRAYPPLVSGEVLYAGQPVAAVAAPSANEVVDALSKIKVEYELLPYVFDAQEALQADAPQLWPGGNVPGGGISENRQAISAEVNVSLGDVATALQNSDVVYEDTFVTTVQQHFEILPRGAIAYWSGGQLTVHATTQWAWLVQIILANYFAIPLSDVIVTTSLGGYEDGGALGNGLGNKTSGEEYVLAAVLAKKVGAPVKFIHTRMTHALTTTNRWPITAKIKLGAMSDGTLTAIDAVYYCNVGGRGGAQGSDAVSDLYNTYVCPNVSISSIPVNTNKFALGAFMRSVGEEQGHFIMESAMDELAQKLNMDPTAFRLKNMRTSANAVDPVAKKPYTTIAQPQSLQAVMSASNWTSKWKGWGIPTSVNGTKRTGIGVSIQNAAKGAPIPPSTSQVQVDPDGTVTVYIGLTDHGAGGNTTFPLIAAEALGLTSMDNVKLIQSDTRYTTNSSVTAGSQSTHNSHSLLYAVEDLKSQWFPTVAQSLGASADNLVFGNDTIYDKTNPSNSISFKNAAALLKSSVKGFGVWQIPEDVAYRSTGARIAEVEVDVVTGEVHVVSHSFALGLGRTIFYKGAMHQMMGGSVMGVGSAFYEEIIPDPSQDVTPKPGYPTSGSFLNPNYHDYEIPTIMENPDTADAIPVQNIDPTGPFGATGIGENTIIGADVTYTNALSNALGGYRFKKTPVRIEDVVAAIQAMNGNAGAAPSTTSSSTTS